MSPVRLLTGSACIACLWALTGCETTPPPAPVEPTPAVVEVAPPPAPPPAPEPVPVTPVIERSVDLPLQTISPPRVGDIEAPFDFLNANARVGLRDLDRDKSIFPLNSTGGNLGFYQDVVGVPKLEVQELEDGRIRIWVRVLNRASRDIKVRVQCLAPMDGNKEERRAFEDVIFQKDHFRDFSFILNGPKDRRFTILVSETSRR